MILRASDGLRGRWIDLDTGEEVRQVIWVDTDTGHHERYALGPDGRRYRNPAGDWVTLRCVGRLRFFPRDRRGREPIEGAPQCARCRSPLTLPGDDLCAVCRAADRPHLQARTNGKDRNLLRVERLTTPFFELRCQHYGCSRLASWAVADEVQVAYQRGRVGGRTAFFERGATVGRRFYCSHHYQPPRILDARGEVVEEVSNTGPR